MSNTDLAAKVQQFRTDSDIAHQIIHGDATTVVQTEGGPVRSLAKLIADNQFDLTTVNTELADHETRIKALESGKENLHQRITIVETTGENTVDSVLTRDISSVKWLVEVTSPQNAPRFRRVFEVTATHDGMFDTGSYPATEVDYTCFGKLSTGDQSVSVGVEVVLINTSPGSDFPRRMCLNVQADVDVLVNVIRQEVVPIVDPAPYIAQLPPPMPTATSFRLVTTDVNTNSAWTPALLDDNSGEVLASLTGSWNVMHFDTNGVLKEAQSFTFINDAHDDGNGGLAPGNTTLSQMNSMFSMIDAVPAGDLIAVANGGDIQTATMYPTVNAAIAAKLQTIGASANYLTTTQPERALLYVVLGKAGVGARYGYPIETVFADGHADYNSLLVVDANNINVSKEYLQYRQADALSLRFDIVNGDFQENFIDIAPPTYAYQIVSQGLESDGSWSGFDGQQTTGLKALLGNGFIGIGETWNLVTFYATGKVDKIQNFDLASGTDGVTQLTDALNALAQDENFVLFSSGHAGANIDNNTYPDLANAVWNNGGSPLWFPNAIGQSGAYILHSKGKSGFGNGKEYCHANYGFIRQEVYFRQAEVTVEISTS